MADPTTPNYNFNLPTVGGDDNVWGDLLNENWSSVDSLLWTVSGVASAALTPTTGDARYLRLTGGTIGPNSFIANGPASFTNYTQVTGQFVSSGGATFGTAQVFFNSQVTFSADALGVTPNVGDNSQRMATTNWVNSAIAGRGFITDAPNDGHQYARQSQAWAQITIPPSGVPEAPTDGQQYARQNAGWTPFVSGPPTTISDTAPASPKVGQLWWDSVGGQLYVWYQDANTSQWVVAVNAASRPPPASTTVLGSVKVDGTSIQAAADGTISTVLVPMGDNRIINGNFAINQRGYAGTALAAAAYGHDRWKAGTGGCTYTFTATVPDTTITITAGTLTQVIEAGMIEGGVYTLSWTGTAQARVYQGTPTGSYAASPLITAALPAGVNTIVEFNAGTVVRAKLEIGSTATPFNRQTMAKSLADCQRYYQQFFMLRNQYATGASAYNMNSLQLCPPMRASPTTTIPGIAVSNCTFNSATSSYPDNVIINVTATAAGVMIVNGIVMANAEL